MKLKYVFLIYKVMTVYISATLQQNPISGSKVTTDDCECVEFDKCKPKIEPELLEENIIQPRSGGQCKAWLTCCKKEDIVQTDNIPTTPQFVPKSDACGRRPLYERREVSASRTDNKARLGEYPWVVAITRIENGEDVFKCGGSLIHRQVVLTAAHCLKGTNNFTVTAGEWDRESNDENDMAQFRNVAKVVIHEKYVPGVLYNDIALLFLESPVDFAKHVGTICLPEQGEAPQPPRNCIANGWGMDVNDKETKYSAILKEVQLPLESTSVCQEALRKTRLGKRYMLHSSFICAGGVPGHDTCKGDGGGPLACIDPDNPMVFVQAGIVAGGIGCGTKTPGVYVNVAEFRNWIDQQIGSLDHFEEQIKPRLSRILINHTIMRFPDD